MVAVGVAAVAVGWKHRSTLLSYATLPARARVRGRPAGLVQR